MQQVSRFLFSVRRVKLVLARDHHLLGFKGQTLWVKPGYANNFLVPSKIAKYAIPKNVEAIQATVDQDELEKKQEQRVLDLYIKQLKKIRCIYDRAVSPLNKQVIELPIQKEEIITSLAIQHGLKLQTHELQLEHTIDTVGEHLIRSQFFSQRFNRSIIFNVKLLVRPR